MRYIVPAVTFSWLIVAAGAYGLEGPAPPGFSRDIRPILALHCFPCHGPNETARKAGLRLDTAEGVLAELVSGRRAVKPGNLQRSALWARIQAVDPDVVMPPPEAHLPLDQQQRDLMRRWIISGAQWEAHWAFLPLETGVATDAGEHAHPIDTLLGAGDAAGAIADTILEERARLLRRLSLDLTGLPPGVVELDAFGNDTAAGAYERQVDRLLDSPHFGERWAEWWLDLAGFDRHSEETARRLWMWRDWVIHAINANLPFDQFTREQLAGDLLEAPSEDQLIATGFLCNAPGASLPGADPEAGRMQAVVDRTNTVARVWMGLDMSCGHCHHHTYDPINQETYYQFLAFFNSTTDSGHDAEPRLFRPSTEQQAELDRLTEALRQAERAQRRQEQALDEAQAEWEAALRTMPPTPWEVLAPAEVADLQGSSLQVLGDGSVLASGENPENAVYSVRVHLTPQRLTGLRLEVLPDEDLPKGGPGRAEDGSFVLSAVEAYYHAPGSTEAVPLRLVQAAADATLDGHDVHDLLTSLEGPGWAAETTAGAVVFAVGIPLGTSAGARLELHLIHRHGGGRNIGRFRWSATEAEDPIGIFGLPPDILDIIAVAEVRTPEHAERLRTFRWQTDSEWVRLEREIAARQQAHAAAERDFAVIVQEREEPRVTRVPQHGDPEQPQQAVTPDTPAFLPPFPRDASRNRLGLAAWLLREDHPLTARVVVNRLWAAYFGQGLAVEDDFGHRAPLPEHLDLIDMLARDFIESGWDFKRLHRLIVTSSAYRQHVTLRHAKPMAPPSEGEQWDRVFAIAGMLDLQIGGKSSAITQRAEPGSPARGNRQARDRAAEDPQKSYRRSLYVLRPRGEHVFAESYVDPILRTACTASMQPVRHLPQRQSLLNGQHLVEAAAALARRMTGEGGASPAEFLAHGFRLCTSRAPSVVELGHIEKLFARSQQVYAAAPDAASSLLALAGHPNVEAPADFAALVVTALAMLQHEETLLQ